MQSTVLMKFPPMKNSSPAQQVPLLGWEDNAMLQFSQVVQKLLGLPGVRIEDRLAAVTAAACKLFDMEYGFITLVRKNTIDVIVATQPDMMRDPIRKDDLETALSQSVISEKMPLLLADTKRSAQRGLTDLTGRFPSRFLGVPLLFDGTVYGTMELSGAAHARPFEPIDLAAAYFLSAIIATPLALLGNY